LSLMKKLSAWGHNHFIELFEADQLVEVATGSSSPV
jgi:hypothetical protein